MEDQSKRISQCVAFLQSKLHLTDDFLNTLAKRNVLTKEEVITIQKEVTSCGKVLEFVCMLKKKDTSPFNKFLQCLEDNDQQYVAQVLQGSHTLADVMDYQPLTLDILKKHLPQVQVSILKIIAAELVPSQVYKDYSLGREVSGSAGSRKSERSKIEHWEMKVNDMQYALKEKNNIIRTNDTEYKKLCNILENTQKEMQDVMDMNIKYLETLTQLNKIQAASVASPRILDKSDTTLEQGKQIDEAQECINKLKTELKKSEVLLENTQIELANAVKREKKCKEMLGLTLDADDDQVIESIGKLKKEGKMSKPELEKVDKELKKAKSSIRTLEQRITELKREKEAMEFTMRQQDWTIKKIQRQRSSKEQLRRAEQTFKAVASSSQLSTYTIEFPGSKVSDDSMQSQYCMLCHAEFTPRKLQACTHHYRPIKHGKWMCCKKQPSSSTVGCLKLPHIYIEIIADRDIILTDGGAQHMNLTCKF